MGQETRETRLKRLRMRAGRRGIKEMDLILMRFAESELAALGPEQLDDFEALLEENDQELYAWVSGQSAPPERHAPMIDRIARQVSGGPVS
ncbi:FAD assembly factor SdhE [Histidinibacterium aquaticum]|uniref:FAD assembly factor SdhE n=1 Tax=Histidinibacterium aquaticum TaxID=2613962 RepID=A0A5J5GPA2_9RHOB|nr:succinate dehydrogenase assembly factor 2 [Histidinibacterium aquaticum]KAA9009887.1 succinate dehydrogenase assembly factor 2 [Histidinibacterium aquaticum]